MKSGLTFRPRARRDLIAQTVYLGKQAREEIALRYHDAVMATCQAIGEQPLSGTKLNTKIRRLQGLRKFPVRPPFNRCVIFYLPKRQSVEVVRVLHGARNTESILELQRL